MPKLSTSPSPASTVSKAALLWPALILIFIQVVSGFRDMPQSAFYGIFLQERFGAAPAAIGNAIAGAQLAGMAAALIASAFGKQLGSKWILVSGLVLLGVSSLAFHTEQPALAMGLWLASGAGGALLTVGGSSYLTQLSSRGSLGMLSALYVFSMTLGGAIGNPIAGIVIVQHGYSVFSWMLIALSALMTVLAIRFVRDQSAAPAAAAGPPAQPWRAALSAFQTGRSWLLIPLRSLPTLFYGMLTVLIPLLLNQYSGSKLLVAAYGTTLLIVASAAQFVAGRAADRLGARLPTQIAYGLIVVSGIGLAAGAQNIAWLFIFGVLGNATAWALSTLMYVWVADSVSKSEHASTFGLLHAVWSVSMIGGSILGGLLVQSQPGLPFLLAGMLNLGSIGLAGAFYSSLGQKAVQVRV